MLIFFFSVARGSALGDSDRVSIGHSHDFDSCPGSFSSGLGTFLVESGVSFYSGLLRCGKVVSGSPSIVVNVVCFFAVVFPISPPVGSKSGV